MFAAFVGELLGNARFPQENGLRRQLLGSLAVFCTWAARRVLGRSAEDTGKAPWNPPRLRMCILTLRAIWYGPGLWKRSIANAVSHATTAGVAALDIALDIEHCIGNSGWPHKPWFPHVREKVSPWILSLIFHCLRLAPADNMRASIKCFSSQLKRNLFERLFNKNKLHSNLF